MYQCSKFSELREIAQWIPLLMPRKTTNNDDDGSSFIVGGYDLYNTHRCDICVDLIIYHANSFGIIYVSMLTIDSPVQMDATLSYLGNTFGKHSQCVLNSNVLNSVWKRIGRSEWAKKGHFSQTWPKSSVRL